MEYRLFIDGIWQLSESGQTYTNVNPADPDEVLGEFQKGNEAHLPFGVVQFSGNNRQRGPEGINELTKLKMFTLIMKTSSKKAIL